MSTFTVDVEVEVTSKHLRDNGFHHQDECNHDDCTATDEMHHQDDCNVIEENNTVVQASKDALHDWHEQTHGYTLWSGCQQEPCNVLTLDYRSRT